MYLVVTLCGQESLQENFATAGKKIKRDTYNNTVMHMGNFPQKLKPKTFVYTLNACLDCSEKSCKIYNTPGEARKLHRAHPRKAFVKVTANAQCAQDMNSLGNKR